MVPYYTKVSKASQAFRNSNIYKILLLDMYTFLQGRRLGSLPPIVISIIIKESLFKYENPHKFFGVNYYLRRFLSSVFVCGVMMAFWSDMQCLASLTAAANIYFFLLMTAFACLQMQQPAGSKHMNDIIFFNQQLSGSMAKAFE